MYGVAAAPPASGNNAAAIAQYAAHYGKTTASHRIGRAVDVKECDIARYTIADLSFGALGRIQRVANKRYPIGRGECKNYNGGVITAEPSCTERACRACANPLRTTTSSLALNDQARYALWIEAKVPTITPVVRD